MSKTEAQKEKAEQDDKNHGTEDKEMLSHFLDMDMELSNDYLPKEESQNLLGNKLEREDPFLEAENVKKKSDKKDKSAKKDKKFAKKKQKDEKKHEHKKRSKFPINKNFYFIIFIKN